MSRVAFKVLRGFVPVAASVSVLLLSSVSHQAMAACSPAPTSGSDTIVCDNTTSPALNTDDGNDTVTINATNDTHFLSNGAATRPYSITTGLGNDTLIIHGGTFDSNVIGNGGNDTITVYGGIFLGNVAGDGRPGSGAGNELGSTVTGNDTITFYGGSVLNGEIQGGNGDDIIRLYGGTFAKVEGNASTTARGDKIFLDGASLGEWEATNTGAGQQELYLRSGSFGSVEGGDDDDDDGGAPAGVNNLANLAERLIIDPINTEQANPVKLEISKGFNLLGGDDRLIFKGANNASEDGNFEFEGNITFEGGDGIDQVTVEDESNVVLGTVTGFENVVVEEESKLRLTGANYTFGSTTTGEIEVEGNGDDDGPSEIQFSAPDDVTLTVGKIELGAPDEEAQPNRLAALPSYYDSFATGGIFRVGASVAGAGGDDDDDDAPVDDDDDGEGEEGGPAGPTNLIINTQTFENHGTITMMNGVVGDSLTINGAYDAASSVALDTELGDSSSPTDKLVLNGAISGVTTLYINNVGGQGAFTGQGATDGIAVVEGSAIPGDAFELAVNNQTGEREVLAGPFAYRLAVTDDAALLQSDILDQVPAYSSAASVGQRHIAAGLDTLYKRLGEIRQGQNTGSNSNGLLWVRGNYADVDVDVTDGYDFSQRTSGVLAGGNLVLSNEGGTHFAAGVFGGYGNSDANVRATIFGEASTSSVEVEGYSAGGYLMYYETGRTPGTGLYIDGVLKADFFDVDMAAASRGVRGASDGDALTASGEIGYGFAIGGGLVVQPQAQLAYSDLSLTSFKDQYDLNVSYGVNESLIGRGGLQVQANLPTGNGGMISPYAIFNVYSEFEGNNKADVSGTTFASDVGGTWYSAGGGVTAKLGNAVSLYGSGEYDFGDVEGWQGSGGVKMNW